MYQKGITPTRMSRFENQKYYKLYIHIYTHTQICVCVCVYVCMYISEHKENAPNDGSRALPLNSF